MRKVFYVKKNPTMPMSNDNWIEMNSFEFEQFIHTPEGHERRYNFGRLDACSEDDAIIYIECGAEKAKEQGHTLLQLLKLCEGLSRYVPDKALYPC